MKHSRQTQDVLRWFEALSQIPRKSKDEERVRAWLLDVAAKKKWPAKTDDVGNVLIRVPATPGREKAPTLVIQGHMDMVCEKTPDSKHDFSKDPIELVYDGDWLKANKTTLGGDNGIAIAIALAMADDASVSHPTLELLFTTDEETGLTGALNLKPGFLEGKILLNLDSEDEGVFTIGCAGGKTCDMTLPLRREKVPTGFSALTIDVSGLTGGHSGVNIKCQRGNALKVLFRAINASMEVADTRLVDAKGGTAHNAIPRDASATIRVPSASVKAIESAIASLDAVVRKELSSVDPNARVKVVASSATGDSAYSNDATRRAIDFIVGLPHGVASMSTAIEGLVETSNNVAKISVENDALRVISSQRSSVMSRLDDLCDRIEGICRMAGGSTVVGDGYPAWEPNWNSPLLAKCKTIYKNLFNKEPVVEVIHAGLECGIIGAKYDGMDMISLGPTLKNPHTPIESLFVPDIDKIWKLMEALFKDL